MAKRAQSKPTYPGCLDHLVAGASGRLVRVFIGRFVGVLAIRLDLCLLPCFFFWGGGLGVQTGQGIDFLRVICICMT